MKNQDLSKSSKILFFGTSEFAVPALRSLINFGYNVVAVVTQPEKPVGRARVVMPSPVKKVALENQVPVFEPHNLRKDEKFFEEFKKLNPDLCVVTAYGKIIPSEYISIPIHGFINIHPSLLPKYRGPSPIQTAIINGDQETGVSVMKIDDQVDHGPILGITNYELRIIDYYEKTEQDLAKLGAELLIDILPKYVSGEIQPKEQEHGNATFTKLLNREDGRISWNKSAEEIYNQIRALNPEPGTWTIWKDKILSVKTAEISKKEVREDSGLVIRSDNDIVVATKKDYLILKQIQLEGGKEMDVGAFFNGHPDFIGSKLE